MKELAKKTLFYGAGVLFKSPSMFSKIRISSNVHLTVPYYHAISNEDIPHLKHIISYKNLTEFRDDISFFSSNYSFIGIPELIDYFSGNHTLPPSPMLITFDDGLKEFYENAAPILEEFKASAAVFINSDFLDNKNMFYRHKESLLVETLLKNKDAEINDRISSILGLAPHLPEFKIKKSLLNIGYSNKALLDKVAEELGLDFNEYLSFVHP